MSDKCYKKVLRRSCQRESPCDELARLETQFRNAYTMKALEAQLAEKQAEKVAKQVQEKLSQKLISLDHEKYIEEKVNENLLVLKNREVYKANLEQQIKLKELKKKKEMEAALAERKVLEEVDELMDKLHQLAKRKRRDCYVEKMRRERLLFEEIRAIKRAIDEEKELKAIERETLYLEEIERRSLQMKIEREHQIKRREALIEKVANFLVCVAVRKHERAQIISDVIAEEMMHEAIVQEHTQKLAKIKAKEELIVDLKNQMLTSIECETRAREHDKLFAEQVMARVMKDERLLKLTAEARKRQQIQYREELEKLIADKMRIRNETIRCTMEKQLYENEMNEQVMKQRIKDERRRLILEHAGNVAEYLKDEILSHDEEKIVKELLDKCKVIAH